MSHPEPGEPFELDKPITSMKVLLHTANVSDAATYSDIFVSFFGKCGRL